MQSHLKKKGKKKRKKKREHKIARLSMCQWAAPDKCIAKSLPYILYTATETCMWNESDKLPSLLILQGQQE